MIRWLRIMVGCRKGQGIGFSQATSGLLFLILGNGVAWAGTPSDNVRAQCRKDFAPDSAEYFHCIANPLHKPHPPAMTEPDQPDWTKGMSSKPEPEKYKPEKPKSDVPKHNGPDKPKPPN
jgi:hypothetical protein